jgi:hypothetical protein
LAGSRLQSSARDARFPFDRFGFSFRLLACLLRLGLSGHDLVREGIPDDELDEAD